MLGYCPQRPAGLLSPAPVRWPRVALRGLLGSGWWCPGCRLACLLPGPAWPRGWPLRFAALLAPAPAIPHPASILAPQVVRQGNPSTSSLGGPPSCQPAPSPVPAQLQRTSTQYMPGHSYATPAPVGGRVMGVSAWPRIRRVRQTRPPLDHCTLPPRSWSRNANTRAQLRVSEHAAHGPPGAAPLYLYQNGGRGRHGARGAPCHGKSQGYATSAGDALAGRRTTPPARGSQLMAVSGELRGASPGNGPEVCGSRQGAVSEPVDTRTVPPWFPSTGTCRAVGAPL
jgi:hypothetical protein